MRTLFDLSVRRDHWTPNIGSPLSMGQTPAAGTAPSSGTTIEDLLKAAVTGGAATAISYENARAAKQNADAAAAQAAAAAAQARGAAAVAAAQNPTVLGMPPLVAGIVGLGLAGIIIAIVASRK